MILASLDHPGGMLSRSHGNAPAQKSVGLGTHASVGRKYCPHVCIVYIATNAI
jgi:hypothetical protein